MMSVRCPIETLVVLLELQVPVDGEAVRVLAEQRDLSREQILREMATRIEVGAIDAIAWTTGILPDVRTLSRGHLGSGRRRRVRRR